MSCSHGYLLEVSGPEALVDAARAAKVARVIPLDAYSPYPVEGLSEAMGIRPSVIPWIMLACGISGALIAFGTMSFSAVVHYPFNVGGRPHFSWPAFVPITFEVMILFSALGGAFALAWLCKLPQPHHPVFHNARFRESCQAGFFLFLPETADARTFLETRYRGKWQEVVG